MSPIESIEVNICAVIPKNLEMRGTTLNHVRGKVYTTTVVTLMFNSLRQGGFDKQVTKARL
jgi:hypothetical protein